ncbi:MAG: hypothetical protein HY699_01110 [Deltaproteobacteria bacterium]|nr:hypothetical protein [Deltaproteobacteria bacterium]
MRTRSLLRAVETAAFNAGLVVLAALVRRAPLRRPTQCLVGWLGTAAARVHGVRRQTTSAGIGRAWQSAFGSPALVPITRIDGDTVWAEVRVHCPLRGSGDTAACYRLMAFDRAIAERAGASFVVVRSQAEPGVSVCEVALRPAQLPITDIIPAHVRCAGSAVT